jgi:hypothetical protein
MLKKNTVQNRGVAARNARAFCSHKPHATNAASAALGACLMRKAVCLLIPSALAMAPRLGGCGLSSRARMRVNAARSSLGLRPR